MLSAFIKQIWLLCWSLWVKYSIVKTWQHATNPSFLWALKKAQEKGGPSNLGSPNVVVVRLEHSRSIDSFDNHSTASGPASCRRRRPPWNASCLVVCWLFPHGQAGDAIVSHRYRDSAHLAWPHLRRFRVTNWRLGRVNPGCGHVWLVTRSWHPFNPQLLHVSCSFDLDSRVVQPRSRKVGEIWDAIWVAHVGSSFGNTIRELLNLLVFLQSGTVTANLWGLDVAEYRQPVDVGWS